MDVNSGIAPVKSRTALASMILSQKRNKASHGCLAGNLPKRDKTVYKEMQSNSIIGPSPAYKRRVINHHEMKSKDSEER